MICLERIDFPAAGFPCTQRILGPSIVVLLQSMKLFLFGSHSHLPGRRWSSVDIRSSSGRQEREGRLSMAAADFAGPGYYPRSLPNVNSCSRQGWTERSMIGGQGEELVSRADERDEGHHQAHLQPFLIKWAGRPHSGRSAFSEPTRN